MYEVIFEYLRVRRCTNGNIRFGISAFILDQYESEYVVDSTKRKILEIAKKFFPNYNIHSTKQRCCSPKLPFTSKLFIDTLFILEPIKKTISV